MMNPIVIPTGIRLTQTQMIRHSLKGMSRIQSLISIGHLSPKPSIFGEIDAVGGMNLDSFHEVSDDDSFNIRAI
jgi:hypothetical protein